MKHLLKSWNNIKRLVSQREILLFLDYDGTLTPIKDHPRLAKFSAGYQSILRGLSKIRGVTITVISGRKLSDVRRMTGIRGLTYSGNHGFEIQGPRIDWVHSAASRRTKAIERIFKKLKANLRKFSGIYAESKKFSLSVHYRKAGSKEISEAGQILKKEIASDLRKSGLILTHGKKVWEIRPSAKWDKGLAVRWLIARHRAQNSALVFPIYIGDDQTDESAFRSIRGNGIAVKVTRRPEEKTFAEYYLDSPAEVMKFLGLLSVAKRRHKQYARTYAD